MGGQAAGKEGGRTGTACQTVFPERRGSDRTGHETCGSRYGKAYPPEYEGVRVRVYPDFMPGGPGFFQTDHASPKDHDPLLFLYQPESQGVCGAGDEG